MLEHDLKKEINQINGALKMLGLLQQKLELELDVVADKTGQEALDETLSYVISLRSEYLRRQQELYPHHKTYLFYLTDEDVLPIPHDYYVPLVEGKSVACEFFNQTFRLADWYVRVEKDVPQLVVNETYSWLVFDQQGRLDFQAAHIIEESPLPTETERERIKQQLFNLDI